MPPDRDPTSSKSLRRTWLASLSIARVLDTHVHADHISGSPTLADEVGVPYHLGDAARERGVEYEYDPLPDGDVIEVGDVEIEALHTPGHTSEMMNYLVDGELLLTGDTLFVDSVGRTELQFGGTTPRVERNCCTTRSTRRSSISRMTRRFYQVTSPSRATAATRTVLRVNPRSSARGSPRRTRLPRARPRGVRRTIDRGYPGETSNYETVIAINTGKETVEDESEATELELGPNNCAA